MKRSSQPVFWVLFGAGGMLAALLGPALALLGGVAAPLGIGVPAGLMKHENALAFAQWLPGKAALAAIVSLFLWHAAHRIFHSLHDVGVHSGRLAWLACYGVAGLGTVATLAALVAIG